MDTSEPPSGSRSYDRQATGRHPQLSEKVASRVREAIMVGEIRSGFLRTERLAEELGVSPTPVREALMLLQAEGAVEWQPRRGFRVNPLTYEDVADLYDVQAYIAGELAARAATILPPSEIDRLDGVQEALEKAAHAEDAELVDRLNHEIHRTINRASGSARMANLLRQTVRYVPLGFFARIDGWSGASANDHGDILRALHKGSASRARIAMAEHIHHIGSLLLDHLKTHEVFSVDDPPSGAS